MCVLTPLSLQGEASCISVCVCVLIALSLHRETLCVCVCMRALIALSLHGKASTHAAGYCKMWRNMISEISRQGT